MDVVPACDLGFLIWVFGDFSSVFRILRCLETLPKSMWLDELMLKTYQTKL